MIKEGMDIGNFTEEELIHLVYMTYMEIALSKMINDCKPNSNRWQYFKAMQKLLKKADNTYPFDELPKEFTDMAEKFYDIVDGGILSVYKTTCTLPEDLDGTTLLRLDGSE